MVRKLLAGAALAAALAPGAALAQAAPILVLDVNRAVAESSAGQSLAQQIKPQAEAVQSLQKSRQTQFDKEIQDLQQAAQAKAVAPEVLQQRQRDLQQRAQTAQTELEGRAQSVRTLEQNGLTQIGQAMQPIVNQILAQRQASVVLRREAAAAFAPAADITQEVITRLNTSLPRVTATAAAPPAQQQRPAATPPKK